MNILFWRKNNQIDACAIALADEFYSNLPPERVELYYLGDAHNQVEKKVEKKITKIIDTLVSDTTSKIQQFNTQQSLGTYGKARLHMQFMGRLVELGYNKDIARMFSENIMLKTAKS